MKAAISLGLALALVMAVGRANAALTQTDVVVAGRAISFIERFGAGEVRVGIVFATDSPRSGREAMELNALFGKQLRVGNLVLTPVMLRTDQVVNADVGLFFLTSGVGAAAGNVGNVSKQRKIPCVTFDLEQVRNGACTVGFRSRPTIEVFVNHQSAVESNTVLSSVFRLMITEY